MTGERIRAVLIVLLAILLTTTFVWAEANQIHPDKKASDEIISKANSEGHIRVIVRLAIPHKPEGELPDQKERVNQRARIARNQEALLSSLSSHKVTHVKKFRYIPFIAMKVNSAALTALIKNPLVASIEEDILMSPLLAESGPLIGAVSSWQSGFTGKGWNIAILDTGVDKYHSFLDEGKVVAEACFSTSDPASYISSLCPNGMNSQIGSGAGVDCSTSISGCGHGTHVAGIAAGNSSGSGKSFNGVAKDAGIIAIQVFNRVDSYSSCNPSPSPCAKTSFSDVLDALEHVYTLRSSYNIAAINMSLGGEAFTSYCDSAWASMKEAIDNLRSVGIASIIASGNNGYTNAISFPACISSAISVGNTRKTDIVYSGIEGSNSASFLSLLAPGTEIYSSIPGSSWGSKTGTSMAAPHVAGAWALLKKKSPSASVTDLFLTLQETGIPLRDDRNGIIAPRLDIGAALGICAYTGNPVLNPGFESGNLNWGTYSSKGYENIENNSSYSHTGSWFAWLGGAITLDDYIYQDITIPSNASQAYAQVWIRIATNETTTSSVFDLVAVQIRNPNNNALLATPIYYTNLDAGSYWEHSPGLNLSEFKGQTVRLMFYSTNDDSLSTSFFLDDIALIICTECNYSLSQNSQSFTASGGSSTINVTPTMTGCSWAGSTDESWINITSGSVGTGNGSLGYTVQPNSGSSQRIGYMMIAGQQFTVTQQGSPSITINSNPSGKHIIVDSVTYTAPQTFIWIPGSSHILNISSPQAGTTGTRYVFSSWSDGGAQSHTITTPSSNTTYIANFTTQHQLTTSVNPASSGTITIVPSCTSGCWYNSGSSISLSPTPSGGNTFLSWTGDISSMDAPLSFSLNGPKNITANFDSTAVTGTVRIAGPTAVYYSTIPLAYAAAANNNIIQTQAMSYAESLTFNRTGIIVTLKGGYNDTFSSTTGKTTIGSPVILQAGTIVTDNIIIQ